MHGRNRDIPKTISIGIAAHVALIVDHYQCLEIVEPFIEGWLPDVSNLAIRPQIRLRELHCNVLIGWVFKNDMFFQTVTNASIERAAHLITTSYPIPQAVLGQ